MKHNFFGKIILLAYLLAVSYICFHQFSMSLALYGMKDFWGITADKFVHFCMFVPFSICFYYAFSFRTDTRVRILLNTLFLFVLGVAAALTSELLQTFVPGRFTDVNDFLADCYGLTLGTVVTLFLQIGRWKEQ